MEKFFNRESSALEFNARVLAEAMDPSNPLLERLKFIGIISSNLDEFFMVRVASLKAAHAPLDEVRTKALGLTEKRNDYFLKTLLPEMAAAGLVRTPLESCNAVQMEYLTTFFHREVLPVLTPIALSNDTPFPSLANLRIHMVVGLMAPDQRETTHYAVVEIPHKVFPRILFLPTALETSETRTHPFVLLEDLIAFFAKVLFPGYEIIEQGFMRPTRGAELTIDEEKDEDFMRVMTEALRERRVGNIVRLEVSTPQEWVRFLQDKMQIDDNDVVVNKAWLDLKTISQLTVQPGFESLKRPLWEPRAVSALETADDLWSLLREKNVLLFHPYESFDAVIRFLETAADDPDVLAIKQTLYRTDPDSPVLRALERAAERGKRVTALIELKARFDEENNIEWARRLASAGASVLYGVAGYKTHAKACLVVRRERDGIRRYVHLGTGNYNDRTARLYSDVGLFTSDDALASDISAFFNMITGYSQPIQWRKIEVAPFGLRKRILRLIQREAMRHTPQHRGLIRAKMNSLVDPEIIEALYKASNAGVDIYLNVRGICCLRPGVKGLSETIHVVSIVDQFLEHGRIFHFANGGEEEVYLSSADWMPRNLDRRIELLFPIEDPANKKRLLEVLDLYFRDNVKSWALQPDGSYNRVEIGNHKKVRAQEILCEHAIDEEKNRHKAIPSELKPQKPRP
ncbi:MAG: polyphosphate kinase 1 [Elusimicrobiota bacterium]|jgi:polyphosphate kinase